MFVVFQFPYARLAALCSSICRSSLYRPTVPRTAVGQALIDGKKVPAICFAGCCNSVANKMLY